MADSAEGPSAPNNADTASIASTLDEEHDSEQEWLVNGVLAERNVDGESKYLIDWQGFPLWQASWEPESNISRVLLESWAESTKDENHARMVRRNIKRWKKSVLRWLQGRLDRHKERNRKRVERGMEPTTGTIVDRWESSMEYLDSIPSGDEDSEDSEDDIDDMDGKGGVDGTNGREALGLPSPRPTGSPEHSTRSPPQVLQLSPIGPAEEVSQSIEPSTDSPGQTEQLPKTNGKTNKEPGIAAATAATPGEVTQLPSPSRNKPTDSRQKEPSKKAPAAKLDTQRASNPTDAVRKSPISPMPSRNSADASLSNVFMGGTKERHRRGLLELSKDPMKTRTPLRHRFQRILEKGSRDREDVIDPRIKPSRLLVLDPAADRRGIGSEEPSSAHGTTVVASPSSLSMASNEETTPTLPTPELDRLPEDQATGEALSKPHEDDLAKKKKKKKKRKSVRWDDNVIVQEPVVYPPEGSLFVHDNILPPSAPSFKIERPEPSNQLNGQSEISPGIPTEPLSAAMEVCGSQNVAKNVQFGTQSPNKLSITFLGLPLREAHSWVSLFEDEDIFTFKHICTAKDFWVQDSHRTVALDSTYGSIRAQQLCRGMIDPRDDDGSSLDALIERLRLGSFGVLYYSPEFSILLYPSRCEDWEPAEPAPTIPHHQGLSYVIFQPNSTFRACFLAPIEDLLMARGQDPPPGARPAVYHYFFGFDYNRLIPSALSETTSHPFFLAIPNANEAEALFLALWLRSCNPDCRIFTSSQPQHWHSFARLMRGIIIIHEDAISAIRLFPGFSNLLHASKGNFSYWVFSRSLSSIRQIPNPANSLADVGDIRLDPVFRPGVAVLLTPSFLVSQPQQAYNLAKWYAQNYCRNEGEYRLGKLVLCGLAVDWLLGLAFEKAEQSQSHFPRESLEREALHEDAVTARFKTYALVRQMINSSARAVLLAPESIDGNDEQSLVNWFGWWTLSNLGEYRKFTVVGSTKTDTKRLTRRIRPPRYPKTIVSNPNDLYLKLDREEQRMLRQSLDGENDVPQIAEACSAEEFQLISNDKPATLCGFLSYVAQDPSREWSPMVLYRYPVSYWNPDMSFHFRDYKQDFESYINCFNWLPPLTTDPKGLSPSMRGTNTVAAFFYTVEGIWDPAAYPPDRLPKRRPWIAFHRPVNCHIKPWRTTELLIWDMTASEILSCGGDIYEEDLIPAQRELIKFIQADTAKKNPTLPLKQVWLGGSKIPPSEYTKPLDVTLHSLSVISGAVREWLPAPHKALPARGWRSVTPGSFPRAMEISSPTPDRGDLELGDDPRLKSVFHPPRSMPGPGSSQGFSKCRNRLYERTMMMSRRGLFDEMEYIFKPTMLWYKDQEDEGRGYEHIRVATWDNVFREYKIPDPKETGPLSPA